MRKRTPCNESKYLWLPASTDLFKEGGADLLQLVFTLIRIKAAKVDPSFGCLAIGLDGRRVLNYNHVYMHESSCQHFNFFWMTQIRISDHRELRSWCMHKSACQHLNLKGWVSLRWPRLESLIKNHSDHGTSQAPLIWCIMIPSYLGSLTLITIIPKMHPKAHSFTSRNTNQYYVLSLTSRHTFLTQIIVIVLITLKISELSLSSD